MNRYPGLFTVKYDIPGHTDFLVPALSLQPLVENSVKHSILVSDRDDKKLILRVQDMEDRYEVSVIDNGPGVDTTAAPSGDSTHIGLDNVRERLQILCGGQLIIDSKPGEGTCARIILPKQA